MSLSDRWAGLDSAQKLAVAILVGVPLFLAALVIGSALIYAVVLLG